MKKVFAILFFLCFGLIGAKAQAIASYNSGTPGQAFQEMWIKGGYAQFDQFVTIDGKQVAGTPFLFPQWIPGVISLKDGRVFNDYKLKFDAYDQILNFLNGTDSLEVVDEIKDFVISAPEKQMKFINAAQYSNVKKPLFYEVLIDDNKGTLLKSYRKVIKSGVRVFGMPEAGHLDISVEYSYYNKKSKKISSVTTAGKISSILNLTPDEEQKLSVYKYDFSSEADLLLFFNSYFGSTV